MTPRSRPSIRFGFRQPRVVAQHHHTPRSAVARALVLPHRSFDDLVRAVRTALHDGQAAADRAYLLSYHRTGQLIDAHLLAHQKRADYGAGVIPKLAETLQTHPRLLYRCLRFSRSFPILTLRSELGWTHYRILLEVADDSARTALAAEAARQHWTTTDLEARVRALNAVDVTPRPGPTSEPAPARRPLTPRRGTPGVCKVVAAGAGLAADLGFAAFLDLPDDTGLPAGAFVRLDAAGRAAAADGATKADLFTYPAAVLKVVDGDTLWVKIYLRPRQWVKQKLRLRDLDCPELSTAEGRAAHRFTADLVARATAVTVCTTKPDKYDRYLADVFLATEDGEILLNNALLAAGHAAVKREWEFSDWEK